MFNRVVMTAGTSLFNPNNEFGLLIKTHSLIRQERNRLFCEDEAKEEAKAKWLSDVRRRLKKPFDPEKVSAEFSILHALMKNKKLMPHPQVVILYTSTFDGELAGVSLYEIFQQSDFKATVKLKEIPELTSLNDRIRVNHALGHYMGLLSEELRNGEPGSTCFAPLGGFKILTSLGYLVGAFHQFPTYYLHEGEQILHEVPPVPIHIDPSLFEKYLSLFRDLYRRRDYAPLNEFAVDEQNFIERNPSFFYIEDEYVALNPFTLFLLEEPRFRKIVSMKVLISDQVKELVEENPSIRNAVIQEIQNFIFKVEHNDQHIYDRELYHDSDIHTIKGKEREFHLYKGGNNPVVRVTWRLGDSGDSLYLHHLWLDHQSYDRQIGKGVGLRNNTDVSYHDWTESIYSTKEGEGFK